MPQLFRDSIFSSKMASTQEALDFAVENFFSNFWHDHTSKVEMNISESTTAMKSLSNVRTNELADPRSCFYLGKSIHASGDEGKIQFFLSHRGPDFKLKLVELLQQKKEFEQICFLDCLNIPGAVGCRRFIISHLAGSTDAIFLLSPDFWNSQYCKEELFIWKLIQEHDGLNQRNMKRNTFIFALENTPLDLVSSLFPEINPIICKSKEEILNKIEELLSSKMKKQSKTKEKEEQQPIKTLQSKVNQGFREMQNISTGLLHDANSIIAKSIVTLHSRFGITMNTSTFPNEMYNRSKISLTMMNEWPMFLLTIYADIANKSIMIKSIILQCLSHHKKGKVTNDDALLLLIPCALAYRAIQHLHRAYEQFHADIERELDEKDSLQFLFDVTAKDTILDAMKLFQSFEDMIDRYHFVVGVADKWPNSIWSSLIGGLSRLKSNTQFYSISTIEKKFVSLISSSKIIVIVDNSHPENDELSALIYLYLLGTPSSVNVSFFLTRGQEDGLQRKCGKVQLDFLPHFTLNSMQEIFKFVMKDMERK